MSDYIIVGGELYHYGVPGMKWGVRRARQAAVSSTPGKNKLANKNDLKDRAARAAKVGAAVVGTALAAYGTYKLAKVVQNKRQQAAMQKASAYIDKYFYNNIGTSTFKNGTKQFNYVDGLGNQITIGGSRRNVGKSVGRQNAKTIATARQMYRDATNTKLDKGLAKVVGAGDSVGNTTRRAARSAGKAVKTSAKKAKNSVLDVVNPIYDYKPVITKTNTHILDGGMKVTNSSGYVKAIKKKRR